MGRSSHALLDLENKDPSSSKESALIMCKRDDLFQFKSSSSTNRRPQTKPLISSVPKSQVLGKLKDFLGVFSESNKKLQQDAKENSKDYNIEVLSDNESEYIEMDLMLGVTDLHTPEAVAAAESAIAGNQQIIPLADSSSEEESGDPSDDSDYNTDADDDAADDDDDENAKGACAPTNVRRKGLEIESSSKKGRTKKRPKIVEL